eukprot:CAMPEP_0119343594 /NCGR_PEP_ID=MMETSP1333-20130426/106431_1 /TAXON_ID=418940 /ORGANISM="Scyphosphaera apsteinii, Strain RCC1455" /LENGTH=136 /DNA_ID=CAMNT_0007355993 /DNA_START=17 /DNA_END=424 /DNA_ORIENTATION=-
MKIFILLLLVGCTNARQLSTRGGCFRQRTRFHPLMAVTVIPLSDQILVKVQTEPAQSAGGILMPNDIAEDANDPLDAFKKKETRYGEVVAIGSAVSQPLQTGQNVVLAPGSGIKVEPEGKSDFDSALYIFKVDDVW